MAAILNFERRDWSDRKCPYIVNIRALAIIQSRLLKIQNSAHIL